MYYDMKQSGIRIRQFRIKSGLTQEQVANKLNVDRSFYSRIESGKSGCSVDLFVQLSMLFQVSLDYIILGKHNEALREKTERELIKEEIEKLTDHLKRFGATL